MPDKNSKKPPANGGLLNLLCPNLRCRKILQVPASCRGQRVRCSYCKTILVVPHAFGFGQRPEDPAELAAASGHPAPQGKTSGR